MKSSKCHNHKVKGGRSSLLSHDVKVRGGNHCMNRGVAVHVLVRAGCGYLCLVQGLKKRFGESFVKKLQCRVLVSTMGDEPVTTEPSVIVVDEEVRSILEEVSLLAFFKNFKGHSDSITRQFLETWKEGRLCVDKVDFVVNAALIAEVSGLPNEGEIVHREKMNQVNQLTKFIRDKETLCWLDSGIARESLPKPWDRVAMVLMKYLTLEGKFRKLFGHHIAFLNAMRNKERINIPLFLFNSMEKSLISVKTGKGKSPLHQGLMKLIMEFVFSKNPSVAGPSKGFSKVSGTPITKAQLLLGPIQAASNADSGDSDSEAEGDSGSQEKLSGAKFPKDKGGRKRKTPTVLNASVAKCSRRSTRLQRKSMGTPSLLDVADSSEEEKIPVEPSSPGGKNCPQKSPTVALSGKEASPRNPLVNEDLKSHLRVLSSLGTSLTSTCACVNLLTLEIRNYLKEVLIILKEEKKEKA
eukprot:Gb_13456 [translate_table: standard]